MPSSRLLSSDGLERRLVRALAFELKVGAPCTHAHPVQGRGRTRPAAVQLPPQARVRRAGLARIPGYKRRHRGRVGERGLAAQAHRQEPQGAEGRPRATSCRTTSLASIERDQQERATMSLLDPAADAQHDGRDGPVERPGAPLHAAGLRRPPHRLAQPPASASRDSLHEAEMWVGRGAHPPLPHQGAGGDAAHLPAVLRPLHAHGPGGQRRAPGRRSTSSRIGAEGALRADARLPAPDAHRARRGGLRRRHRQPAHPAARALRQRAARHPQHPRHPPGLARG